MTKSEQAQALLSLRSTPGWELIEAEIRKKAEYHRGRLMDCKTWDEVLAHRAGAEALESVLVHIEQTIREGVEEE